MTRMIASIAFVAAAVSACPQASFADRPKARPGKAEAMMPSEVLAAITNPSFLAPAGTRAGLKVVAGEDVGAVEHAAVAGRKADWEALDASASTAKLAARRPAPAKATAIPRRGHASTRSIVVSTRRAVVAERNASASDDRTQR